MKNRGFSLIELMGCIALIALISLLVVPNIIGLYNKAMLKTMITEEGNVKSAGEMYVQDYCIDPLGASYVCPNTYKNVVTYDSKSMKYVCLKELQTPTTPVGAERYIGEVQYKKTNCKGVVLFVQDANTLAYSNIKTYLYCETATEKLYETDAAMQVKTRFATCFN